MPDFYASLATVAQNLLDRFGANCDLHIFAKPVANDVTPWKPSTIVAADQVVTVRMVMIPKTRENQSPLKYADGTEQRVGDLNVFIGPKIAIPPDVTGIIVRPDGSRWSIKTLTPLDPGGLTLLYEGWLTR